MKIRWLTIGMALGLAVSVASAQSGKKGIEVIDLDPTPRNTNLPLDKSSEEGTPAAEAVLGDSTSADEASSAGTGEEAPAQTESGKTAAAKFADIESKKSERLDRIRALFGKWKGDATDDSSSSRYDESLQERISRPVRPAIGPVEEPAEPPATPGGTYTVQRGDTLAKIAKRLYGTAGRWTLIADANNMGPTDRLKVGQELTIPSGDADAEPAPRAAKLKKPARKPAAKPAAAPKAAKPAADGTAPEAPRSSKGLDYASYEFKLYQVQEGDTLASVANKFYHGKGDPSLIKLYNNKKETLKPGEKILIPLPKGKS